MANVQMLLVFVQKGGSQIPLSVCAIFFLPKFYASLMNDRGVCAIRPTHSAFL